MAYSNFVTNDLPNSLSDEELQYNLIKANKGDKQARNIIIEHNIKFVFHIVNTKLYNLPYEKEELYSIGLIGLIKGIDSYRFDKNVKFLNYVSICIRNEILMYAKKNKKFLKNQMSFEWLLDDELHFDILNLNEVLKSSCDIENDYLIEEEYTEIKSLLTTLDEVDRLIMELYFGFRGQLYKQQEISKIVGFSQPVVARRIKKA